MIFSRFALDVVDLRIGQGDVSKVLPLFGSTLPSVFTHVSQVGFNKISTMYSFCVAAFFYL